MKFTHYNLGYRSGGEIVILKLSNNSVFVRLMDSVNFQFYQIVKKHKYYGGFFSSSTVRLQIPYAGNWHIAIDQGSETSPIQALVRVFPQSSSPLNEATLLSVPSLIRARDSEKDHNGVSVPKFDVFILHAFEDTEDVSLPLVKALQQCELKVSVDRFGIKMGEIFKRRINAGLANSRLALLIISKAFLEKGWTSAEMDSLVTKGATGEQVILPIWHNVSRQDMLNLSSLLASKLARSTYLHSIEDIASEIAEALNYNQIQEARKLTKVPVTDIYKDQPLPVISPQTRFYEFSK
jgi:hypothetical protein